MEKKKNNLVPLPLVTCKGTNNQCAIKKGFKRSYQQQRQITVEEARE